MFRSLFLLRRLLVTTFLVVFVNVFVGQCYCASLRPAQLGPPPVATPTAKPAPTGPGHACCRKAAASKGKELAKRPSAQNSRKPAGPDGCCRLKAASPLAASHKPGEKSQFSLAPALLPACPAYCRLPAAGQWDHTLAVRLVRPEHLPPKIPDIRIFIQSLTV